MLDSELPQWTPITLPKSFCPIKQYLVPRTECSRKGCLDVQWVVRIFNHEYNVSLWLHVLMYGTFSENALNFAKSEAACL